MTHNSDNEIIIDKLANIDASRESWNVRFEVVMIWKQTYKNNSNMVNSLAMILMEQELTKNGDDNDGEPFNCDGCGGVSDVDDKLRVVIRVQDETGSASFVLFDRHAKDVIHRENHWLMEKIANISKFNLQNNYHAYTIHKMTDDELVVGVIFKHSLVYEEDNIHSDGTPMYKSIKENSVSVEGDNINGVDLDVVTPTTTSLKRPIEIVTTTKLFECSSSKDGVAPDTLKIPKIKS
uniref:Replication factor A C-terminal domain-containing protein n=1 Tax=Lactuca sativa TaxID=4236 RepID=A0A9R1WBG9_LACSA|nr:hypothetical protein LSAT_V11C200056600 [Lactuca sativa]